MRKALRDIVDRGLEEAKLGETDTVLDIGSNDGTLLGFYDKSVYRIGYEPSQLAEEAAGTGYIVHDYFHAKSFRNHFETLTPKLVTAIAMFYDLEDPVGFAKDVGTILHPDGVFTIQQNYLPSMLEQNGFDNVNHEHLCYYSLSTLKRVLDKAELDVYRVETNMVNGGSFRVYACHKDNRPVQPSVSSMLKWERKWVKLDSWKPYRNFTERVREIKYHLNRIVREQVFLRRKVFVLGASTRGNTILQYCGLTNEWIQGAVDKNRDKWGLRTVGTNIPIMSREEAGNPDLFLVLPWHFLDEFREQEREWLANGGRFIMPLPQPRVLVN